ncbi:hypothetical protein OSB04_023301 [Centaurea solstitialis]|uniref:Uncharacterized protein n=1 Tax=Centaurea solstitialis TaxID=347529 RepID=A0AA38SKK1_9ASTR|nr:hypothetical protein OSB04_023301 [Centaurea solstitialis]
MGCFIGCFGSSKKTKCKKQKYKIIRRDQKNAIKSLVKAEVSLVKSIKEKPCNLVSESREKIKVPLRLKRRKKVTFDTNVTTHTYERIQVYDSTEYLLENNEKGKAFLSQFNTNSKYDLVGLKHPNYRYVNCRESDDEVENFDHEDYDLDQNQDFDGDNLDDNDDRVLVSSMESRAESSSWSTIGLKGMHMIRTVMFFLC